MSPTPGCYGDRFADTPSIDRLASDGVRYKNALASAPVCSPSRFCLINSLIALAEHGHGDKSIPALATA